ncbi:lytic transglycosylase domain-containing protein [Parasedimentitalea marina]|uniref:Lytic transglycosylase domain-containing protein n=1 Tax=Parasedimentitalea marina TaxID=2483033 RepID=A0A3T0N968_9RHOB|nr:lytic transglycosylase domain-containing protein [Parasedimentitalea marina]AZV80539.1 lytic transglycosylase domain-containing protein [Parasedimentitalea marina]
MTRILIFLALFSALWTNSALAQQGQQLGAALDLMRSEKWSQAATTAAKSGDVAADVIEWHRLREGMGSADDALAFLQRRPDWPGLAYLRRKSEPAVAAAGTDTILKFYATESPQTAEGVLSFAKALIATGKRGDGEANLVVAWRTMAMGSGLQAAYLKDYSTLLKPHHAARLDRLLWDKHLVSSKRMLSLVPDGDRKLAEARIALKEKAAGVDAKIEAIPEDLRNAPGLAHDRFNWRDRKKRREDAIKLMLERSASASGLGEPEQWARRRRDLARQDMRDGNHQRAYQLAARHFTTPEAGYNYSDLEWLAGYIALQKLNDPASAVQHFLRFLDSIETPISIGRGGYWLGRAYAAQGEPDKAHEAYALGANYQTSFYGLLAAEQIGRGFNPALENPPVVPSWEQAGFAKSTVTKAALMMIDTGELDLAERFLTHLVEGLDEVQARQLGLMAVEMDQSHLAVMIAKRAARQSMELHGAYFPLHPVAKQPLPMAMDMVLAISRRESEFDHVVISGAGARGLMQVMPATAKLVAGELGILAKHATSRLTAEWDYNAKLGANYLAGLAGSFNGNVVMMAAGYNAGPRRPIAWMERYGDPRDGTPDIVDWIEHIPFNETRNYVMRVTESLPVYRARLGKTPLPIPFSQELSGSTLSSFAP